MIPPTLCLDIIISVAVSDNRLCAYMKLEVTELLTSLLGLCRVQCTRHVHVHVQCTAVYKLIGTMQASKLSVNLQVTEF